VISATIEETRAPALNKSLLEQKQWSGPMGKVSPMSDSKRRVATANGAMEFEDEYYSFSSRGPRKRKEQEGAALAGVIETLYSEHGYFLSLLDTLEQEAEKLKPGRIPDYHLLLDIVDYLTHYPDQYHHPREDMLFAKMLSVDKSFKRYLERLEREHKTLRTYNDKLFAEFTRIAAGRRVDRPELLRNLQRYISGYRQHIEFESKRIFPRAKGELSSAELNQLQVKTRYIDDPLFGGRLRNRFRRVGRSVQAGISGFRTDMVSRQIAGIETAVEGASGVVEKVRSLRAGISQVNKKALSRPSWQARMMNTFTRFTMKPMMRFGSVESLRKMTAALDEQSGKNLPQDINAKLVSGPGYDGEWIRIGRSRPKKVILYFPGGGFIMRMPVQHRGFVAKICRAAKSKALLVHYRLAPEIPFPGGLEDCLAAYHDLPAQGIAAADITIAGDSAGGGLVLSTLLALRDEGTPLPRNAIVLSPLADLSHSGKSRKFNKHKDPVLSAVRTSGMKDLYIGEAVPEDRFVSPVFADFDDLPPLLGIVGSTEILLDDTVLAAERAREAKVPFYLEIWDEMPHVFAIFSVLPESQVAIERMAEFINSSKLDPLPERYGRH
jgi:monoterpene epsilon-lactone hydrolase